MLDHTNHTGMPSEEVLARLWRSERIQALRDSRTTTPRTKTETAILDLMADGRERTVDDVARKIGKHREYARKLLMDMARAGDLSVDEIHLEGLARAKLYRRAEARGERYRGEEAQ